MEKLTMFQLNYYEDSGYYDLERDDIVYADNKKYVFVKYTDSDEFSKTILVKELNEKGE